MNLIMVEGLPGTGKSTITEWLSKFLSDRGKDVTPLFEGDMRIPCDFYETAGIPLDEFKRLCIKNKELAGMKNNILITDNYAYMRFHNCSKQIVKLLEPWDMGEESNDEVKVKDYIACALERLRFWVDNMTTEYDIVIVDSGFLQNPINELLFRHATDEEVLSFIKDIFDSVRELNPLCIYLCRNSSKEAMDYAKKVKGDEWANRVESLLKETGCENLFDHRFELEKQLLSFIPNIICEVNDDDWSKAKKKIKDIW